MLSFFRDKIKGWVAYLIIALIVVPFALFGISQYFTGESNIVVASVDGNDISKARFLQEFSSSQRRLQQELGEKYSTKIDQELKIRTIQSMVRDVALKQLASDFGYATTPGELLQTIKSNEAFKVDGKFSFERYQQLLRINGFSSSEYEASKLDELTQRQIKDNLLDSAFITPSALKRIQLLNNQQRKFSYITMDVKDYLQQAQVDEQSIIDFYQSKKEVFFEPQKVKVDFIKLSSKAIAKDIKASEEDLRNFYKAEQGRFSSEEERKVGHILFANKEQANAAAEELKQGGNFVELTRKYSIDEDTKDQGGDLGFITSGVMAPDISLVIFALQKNETSIPLKSEFGYHIFKVNEIKPFSVKSFAEVRDELLEIYTENEAQKKLNSLIESLANLAYESSLEEAGEQMSLKIQTSDFFSADSKQYSDKFVALAFSNEVIDKGENSQLAEIEKGEFVVLRVNQKIAQRQKEFTEVDGEIKEYLSRVITKKFIDDTAQKIADLFTNGDEKTAQNLMEKASLKWQDIDWVKRDSKQIEQGIIKSVFSLKKPDNKPIYGAYTSDLHTVILKLSAIKYSNEEVSDKVLKNLFLNFTTEEFFISIMQIMDKKLDIKIFEDLL
ncbi:MAG: peptidylprolyl isomerase [Candidatus Thioglobus sp.]|nr:MAG: peptidylprolyl isomerase [Candidatus Thioglobus sp.]KAA0456474.1 MAG: peptidylprolyl isomerase [Candidatus Thioglobus sp.]